MKFRFAWASLLILVGSLFWPQKFKKAPRALDQAQSKTETRQDTRPQTQSELILDQKTIPSASSAILENAPSRKTLRQEAVLDPHAPPPSLLKFAESLAPHLKQAMQSEYKGREFFQQLEVCVLADAAKTPAVIQALCLSNAKGLVERYPSFIEKYQTLKEQARPEVVSLAE